jgi:hypothetical protein
VLARVPDMYGLLTRKLDVTARGIAPLGVVFYSFCSGASEPPSWSSAAIRDLWEFDLYNVVGMVPFP